MAPDTQTNKTDPSTFGLKVKGMLTNIKATPKGYIATVSMGESQCKIFSKENSLEYGQIYHGLCNMAESGNMLFERVRLPL